MQMQLGWKAKDVITGFEGVITGRVEYLTGCNQCLLTPKAMKGVPMPDPRWFDEQRLKRVGSTEVKIDNGPNPGFDKAAPIR